MTTATGTCGGCGAAGPVGAVHVYRGAGIVLRCPHCDNTLAKIVKNDSRVWIDLRGIRTLEVAVQSQAAAPRRTAAPPRAGGPRHAAARTR